MSDSPATPLVASRTGDLGSAKMEVCLHATDGVTVRVRGHHGVWAEVDFLPGGAGMSPSTWRALQQLRAAMLRDALRDGATRPPAAPADTPPGDALSGGTAP